MITTIQDNNDRIGYKDMWFNILANITCYTQYNEEKLRNHLKNSYLRRRSFCKGYTEGEYFNMKHTFFANNQELNHLLNVKNRLARNAKQTIDFSVIDRCFVVCMSLFLIVICVSISIVNPYIGLFSLMPLLILFSRCLYIEIVSKRYSVISNCLKQAQDATKERGIEQINFLEIDKSESKKVSVIEDYEKKPRVLLQDKNEGLQVNIVEENVLRCLKALKENNIIVIKDKIMVDKSCTPTKILFPISQVSLAKCLAYYFEEGKIEIKKGSTYKLLTEYLAENMKVKNDLPINSTSFNVELSRARKSYSTQDINDIVSL